MILFVAYNLAGMALWAPGCCSRRNITSVQYQANPLKVMNKVLQEMDLKYFGPNNEVRYVLSCSDKFDNNPKILEQYHDDFMQCINQGNEVYVDFNDPKSLLNRKNMDLIRKLLDDINASPYIKHNQKQAAKKLYSSILLARNDLEKYQKPSELVCSIM